MGIFEDNAGLFFAAVFAIGFAGGWVGAKVKELLRGR